MKALLRDPLLHFLLLAAGLFVVHGCTNAGADDDRQTIVVDRERLLTFLQYRSQSYDPERLGERLDRFSETELQECVNAYVREEALYREAKALQLDKNDYFARRRLVQQFEFVTRGFADLTIELTADEIENYYAAHQADFSVGPEVTFTHVFFSSVKHGEEKAEALAREELRRLNGEKIRFNEAPDRGDSFLYYKNYVRREPEEIVSHFGKAIQEQLFSLGPSDRTWRGPFRSPHGFHLVLIISNEAGQQLPLAAVRTRVEQAASQAKLDRQFEDAVRSLVKEYRVKLRLARHEHRPAGGASL